MLTSVNSGASTYYYLYDGEANVIGLVDSSGARQATYTYDPYGNTSASGSAAGLNPYRFQVGYEDSTGLYHFGDRYYNPVTGEWTQFDSSGQSPAYEFDDDDPANESDPTGQVGESLTSTWTVNGNFGERLWTLSVTTAWHWTIYGVVTASSSTMYANSTYWFGQSEEGSGFLQDTQYVHSVVVAVYVAWGVNAGNLGGASGRQYCIRQTLDAGGGHTVQFWSQGYSSLSFSYKTSTVCGYK